MRIALFVFQITQSLGARTAAFVNRHERLGRQVVLFDNSLNEARQLVGAAAFTSHDDKLDRFFRCPFRMRRIGTEGERRGSNSGDRNASTYFTEHIHEH
jgi:hypothetical protein